ncbi:peptide MFS transporter [Vibrio parahaemolyticus]|uniref:peptide MFS transporter n=1 Tax=Vibrio parahaemolyticus TaxID=670 RepID=UPI0035C1F900
MWNKLNKSMMFCQMMFGLSFYGVLVSLTRFFLEDLNYNEADTMMIVGAFSAIGPLFAIAGGFIADKFLGAYRSLSIAFLAFAAGYVLLVLGASATNVPLSMCQEDFEKGYPINYSVNNVGAFLGQYLFPMIVLVIGFNGGFTISAVMAGAALVMLLMFRKGLTGVAAELDQKAVSLKNWVFFALISVAMIALVFFMFSNMDIGQNIVYAIGGAAILYFVSLMLKASKAESLKMGTILIVTFLTTCFFVYYGQMMTSMNMVAINTLKGSLFGFIPLEPEAAMAMNPLWCMVGGPIVAGFFGMLEKRDVHLSTATKIAMAFVLTAIAFGILTFAVTTVGEDVVIMPEIFLAIHFFQAIAEVIVGSMVVAFILSVAPKHIENFSVSLFSVAIALSGIVGAAFSTSIAMEKGQEITQEIVQTVYGDYFQLLTVLAVVMVAIAMAASVVIRKMLDAAKESEAQAQPVEIEAGVEVQS